MNLDKLVTYFMRLIREKFTGKLHITIDKGRIVDFVNEKKEDATQFQT